VLGELMTAAALCGNHLRRVELDLYEKDAFGKVGTAQVSVSKISSDEVSPSQVGASEVSGNKVGPSQVSASEIDSSELGTDDVGSSAVGLLTRRGILLLVTGFGSHEFAGP
jgi:hypothetical protein